MNNRITQFSACRKYRYVLWRGWDTSDCEYLMVIGVNPSIANEADDDPTVTACLRVAKELGETLVSRPLGAPHEFGHHLGCS